MISIKNITKKYGEIVAVNNASFNLAKGEIVGFLGPNGAGKSTTIKIITGALQADSGSVNIFGHNLSFFPVNAKKKIGYLSEDNPLPPEMYVREYLEYVAGIYHLKNKKEAVEISIEKFGLKNESNKKISALSKGNRQKLGLAQSLIHDPEFLVLDEPTSALDPSQQSEIRELINNLGKSKIILLSTHILHELEDIASRIIIIDKGKIMDDKHTKDIDSVEELYHNIVK